MNVNELKEYIVENELIFNILDSLNCYKISNNHDDFRCGLPDDYNQTRVSVNKKTLYTRIFLSTKKRVNGDIFTLVMHIKDITFPESNMYIHNILGIEYTKYNNKNKENPKKDPLRMFKKIRNKSYANTKDIDLCGEDVISEYQDLLHISWVREGIMPWTRDVFNIGYSEKSKRIIIPHRYWSGGTNDYIGVMGRTTVKNYEVFGIPKYYPMKRFYKSINLYGLQENYMNIQRSGYVTVFEAEKSVLKRHSRLDCTGAAICSHDISLEQEKILIGLNVEIVIALDEGIPLNYIRGICDRFYGIREVSYIWDKTGKILDKKESPADKDNKLYEWLFKHRVKYDELERREYKKWLEKQKTN